MSVLCSVCGELWDGDVVFKEMEEGERNDLLYGRGCPSCRGESPSEEEIQRRSNRFLIEAEKKTLDALQELHAMGECIKVDIEHELTRYKKIFELVGEALDEMRRCIVLMGWSDLIEEG